MDGSRRFTEVLERSLAATLLAQGKTAEAEIYARQAIRHSLERGGRDSTDVGQGLRILASILAEEGRLEESTLLARAALDTFLEAGAVPESRLLSDARRALAAALVAQRRYGEALQVFEELRAGIAASPELLAKTGAADLDWVLALLRTGNVTRAEQMARAMYDWARQRYGEGSARSAEVRGFLAMTLGAAGRPEEAFQAFAQAVPILLDQARNDAEAETGSRKRQQRLLLILGKLPAAAGAPGCLQPAPAQGLRCGGRVLPPGRHRPFQWRAAGPYRQCRPARIDDPALAELARKEQDAQRRINSLNTLLTQLLSAAADQQLPQVQQKIRSDVDALRQQRESYRKDIARRFPRLRPPGGSPAGDPGGGAASAAPGGGAGGLVLR